MSPAILRMRSSTRQWPNQIPSKAGRSGSLVKWAKPNETKRVKYLANGARIMPNRGDVILRGSC